MKTQFKPLWLLGLFVLFFCSSCDWVQDKTDPKTSKESPAVRYQFTLAEPSALERIEQEDDRFVPVFRDPEINELFAEYPLSDFKQAYPDSRFPYLQAVYELETEGPELINQLTELRPQLFLAPELIPEPTPLATYPNDFGLATNNSQQDLEWVNLPDAWDITTGDPNILIGIADTGFDVNHPDFAGKIANLRSNNTLGNSMDHGTAVASIAGVATNNSLGIAAAGYNCRLDLAAGLHLGNALTMSDDGTRIVNNSWFSSCSPSATAEGVCHEIYENGTVTTWGAGNGYHHCQFNETYPPAYPHNLAITSIGSEVQYGQMSSWPGSGGPIAWNWQDVHWNVVGRTDLMSDGTTQMTEIHNHFPGVDLSAPGYHDRVATNGGGYYTGAHGTSFAAPMVAGVVGLMLSVNPCLSPYQIEVGLKTTSVNIDQIPENQQFAGKLGAGRLDAHAAVLWAQSQPCNDPATATMVITGYDLNTLCKPGHATNGVLPKITPRIAQGTPPYTALWTPLPGNNASLSSTTAFAPEVSSASGANRVFFRCRITDSSPIPKVAVRIVDFTLTTNTSPDLAMRDSYVDPLGEPNLQTTIDPRDWSIWQSPDVWNRQAQDGVTTHENPEYFTSAPNHAYARIRNIGCTDNPPGGQLRLYWSKASTGEDWDQDWTTTNVPGANGSTQPGGREITSAPITIPVIPPGSEWITSHPWNPVRPQAYDPALSSVDVCFLARIEESPSSPFGMAFPEVTLVKDNIRNNNNIVSRNFIVTDLNPNNLVDIHEVTFANPDREPASFDLEISTERDLHPHLTDNLSDAALLTFDLKNLLSRWEKGGRLGNLPKGALEGDRLRFDGKDPIRLENIRLSPDEHLPFLVEIARRNPSQIPLRIHIRQYRHGETSDPVGAVTFEIAPHNEK